MPSLQQRALAFQSVYYVVTGVWPFLSRRTFEAVTGKKVDWWLVQTVGLLVVTNGLTIALGNRKEGPSPETVLLAALSAISFTSIEVVYVAKRRISPVYLLDAAIEIAILAALRAPIF
jgi:hypothetical protein